jgi:hypothetical protein
VHRHQVIICCLDDGSGAPKVSQPAKGSYACLARVMGLQRLPSSQQAILRLEVTDRVTVEVCSYPWPALYVEWATALFDRS